MTPLRKIDEIRSYFQDKLQRFGTTPRGADWNSESSQNTRFDQLVKVIDSAGPFTILDYGCGYGALADYLAARGYQVSRFVGYDILESMIEKARALHQDGPQQCLFTTEFGTVPAVDYAVASGVFNVRQDHDHETWTEYVVECLDRMNERAGKGFASNFLTKYSDPALMKPHLYYADPCWIFDFCKTHYSRNVALLHDYNLYDFTILVRKKE